MPSLLQVVSSLGEGKTLKREVAGRPELENRAVVFHSETEQFEYSKFTFIITILVIREQNLSQ